MPSNKQLFSALDAQSVIDSTTYSKVVMERRFMTATTVCTIAFGLAFAVALATPGWVIVQLQRRHTIQNHAQPNTPVTFYVGVWGELRSVEGQNEYFFRTQAAFGTIAILLMLSSNTCAIYSLCYLHRYVYKRLAACLHGLVALALVVINETVVHSVRLWSIRLSGDPNISSSEYIAEHTSYSYSTVISWFTFAVYLCACVTFIVGSRKRKGSRAATQEFEFSDRPFELGR